MHFVLDELQAQMEVGKLDTLKASKMKKLVVKGNWNWRTYIDVHTLNLMPI
jgi:hypothetical protein